MNSLSWLVYFSNVIPNIGAFMLIVGVLSIFTSGVAAAICAGIHSENSHGRYGGEPKYARAQDYFNQKKWKFWIKTASVGLLMMFLSTLVPSERTMYMIAASEIGETIVTSPEAEEVLGELKDTILFKLNELQEEKKDE